MKKFIVAILAVFYLSTALGTTLHIHYCMGELVDWSLVDKKGENCNNCGMERNSKETKDCCKDEQKQLKLDNHLDSFQPDFHLIKMNSQAIPISFELPESNIYAFITETPSLNSPPWDKPFAVYLRNCVFRI